MNCSLFLFILPGIVSCQLQTTESAVPVWICHFSCFKMLCGEIFNVIFLCWSRFYCYMIMIGLGMETFVSSIMLCIPRSLHLFIFILYVFLCIINWLSYWSFEYHSRVLMDLFDCTSLTGPLCLCVTVLETTASATQSWHRSWTNVTCFCLHMITVSIRRENVYTSNHTFVVCVRNAPWHWGRLVTLLPTWRGRALTQWT